MSVENISVLGIDSAETTIAEIAVDHSNVEQSEADNFSLGVEHIAIVGISLAIGFGAARLQNYVMDKQAGYKD